MKKHLRLKAFFSLLSAVCLVGTYLIMFYNVNNKYLQNTRVIIEENEPFAVQNAQVTVTKVGMFDKNDVKKYDDVAQCLTEDDYMSEENFNLVLIDVSAKNTTDKKIKLDLTSFHLESGAYSSQFYYPLFFYYNYTNTEIKSNEEKTFTLPYLITKYDFLDYDWEKVKNREYYLVSSLYPQKTMFKVNF